MAQLHWVSKACNFVSGLLTWVRWAFSYPAGPHCQCNVTARITRSSIPDAAPGDTYSLVFADGRTRPDPVSRSQPEGVHGPSRVVDPDAFFWSDRDWEGIALSDYIFYELHIGTFTPEGTFRSAVSKLEHLKNLGITAVELMPVGEFPGSRNWGYDQVDLYAPHSAYGGSDGLKAFVNACHQAGLAVVLDVVYNHLGPEGNYLGEFGPYFTDQYRTPWGRAMNFDGSGSDAVRRFVIDNALYWLTEFHIDALTVGCNSRHLRLQRPPHSHGTSRQVSCTSRAPGAASMDHCRKRSQRCARAPLACLRRPCH